MEQDRQLTQAELIDIVWDVSLALAQKFTVGSVMLPNLVAAALEFSIWLEKQGRLRIDSDAENEPIKNMLLIEMKKRV
jgi:hypothetical protein